MRFLDRANTPKPNCLSNTGGRTYNELHGHERNQIRETLWGLQEGRCAYCERRVGRGRDDGHIEHWCRQCDFPELQLDWLNVYWSCNDQKTCGRHKDAYLAQKLSKHPKPRESEFYRTIQPSKENPESLLQFVGDGTVRPREGIAVDEHQRASNTIDMMGLAEPGLVKIRAGIVKPYVDAVSHLLPYGWEVAYEYAVKQLASLEAVECRTAVIHSLNGEMF